MSYVAYAFSSEFRNSILSPDKQVRAFLETIKNALNHRLKTLTQFIGGQNNCESAELIYEFKKKP